MATRYHFAFRSSGMGETHWNVYDRETATERTIRVPWESNVARFMCDPMPSDLLAAFNAWRLAKHDADRAEIGKRYGADALAQVGAFVEYVAP